MDEVRAAIARIRSAGQLEDLVAAVLRRADKNYRGLIQTGLGRTGKPKTSPLDGIYWIPRAEPPRGVALQATTAQSLRHKWLNEDEGDISKALRSIARVRRGAPDAKFTIVLASNSDPDSDLVIDAHHAVGRHAELDLWPLSRLAEFIALEPEGQWVGAKLLGLPQQLVSLELLLELGAQSERSLRENLFFREADVLIERDLEGEL